MQNSQIPIEQQFDETELGLQPPDVKNRFLINYIKTLSFLLGRDENNLIWRMLRVDANGSLKTTTSPQSTAGPIITQPLASFPLGTKVLKANPLRRQFMIINNIATPNVTANVVFLTFGTQAFINTLQILPGWGYKDDTWNGDVWVQPLAASRNVWVIEYF